MTSAESSEQVTGPFKETPLTIREHMDPDKHWIGETLPAPTQTEIAGTVGTVSGPGDSPFPARADHLHKIEGGITSANLIFPAGWENYGGGYATARVTKYGYIVVCQGLVKRSVGAAAFSAGLIATLPAGYFPTAVNLYAVIAQSPNSLARIDVYNTGTINLAATPAISLTPGQFISLNSVWAAS